MTTAEKLLHPTLARAIALLADRTRNIRRRLVRLSEKSARRDAYAESARSREELHRLWLR